MKYYVLKINHFDFLNLDSNIFIFQTFNRTKTYAKKQINRKTRKKKPTIVAINNIKKLSYVVYI